MHEFQVRFSAHYHGPISCPAHAQCATINSAAFVSGRRTPRIRDPRRLTHCLRSRLTQVDAALLRHPKNYSVFRIIIVYLTHFSQEFGHNKSTAILLWIRYLKYSNAGWFHSMQQFRFDGVVFLWYTSSEWYSICDMIWYCIWYYIHKYTCILLSISCILQWGIMALWFFVSVADSA